MTREFNNQREEYPIVLVPAKILKSIENSLDEGSLRLLLNYHRPKLSGIPFPEKPSSQVSIEVSTTKITDINGCMILIVLGVSLMLGFSSGKTFLEGLGYSILIIIAETIAFFILGQGLFQIKDGKKTISKLRDQNELQELTAKYEKDLIIHQQKNEIVYKKYLEDVAKFEETIDQRKDQIRLSFHLKALPTEVKATRGNPSLKRGLAELRFLELLQKEMRDLTFIDMVISYNSKINSNVYTPDFTLICPKTGLHIDIEIDEPYSIKEKLPIHFIDCGDEKRDNFFLDHNWCVIRFSEFQIIKNPDDCLQTIKSVYNSLLTMKPTYTTELVPERRWTYEDSYILQSKKYREGYLS
jgi:hypothetical protein